MFWNITHVCVCNALCVCIGIYGTVCEWVYGVRLS